MSKSIIERYLRDISGIHGTGSHVAETSFYPALERMLTDIGSTLTPKVRCVINPKSTGAGIPDGGLFTADQFRRSGAEVTASAEAFKGLLPSRGVIEAKAPQENVEAIAGTEQVSRYWEHYRVVLVTNFRAFILIGTNPSGKPCILEKFSLADSEDEFWHLASHPRKGASEHGERMFEYLKRVLLCNAPLCKPEDVAAILASYAHDARLRIQKAELPALKSVRDALEEALGLHFVGERGEHFFRSTLIQTLFYGVFSAWVFWARKKSLQTRDLSGFQQVLFESSSSYSGGEHFDWRTAQYLLRVPMLRALFSQVADPGHLGALGLTEVLDWTAAALNRVNRNEFFESFDEGHAVQYFYEPFLQAFDPELRKELGVWYTPEEIVHYQVERVDAVLRSELGIADGLADPNVVVLDPCCGTGAYLRAVLRRIAATLREKGGDALMAQDLKRTAMERVFGFEILPAPFVVAHLQLGLELENLGVPLQEQNGQPERVGVYLTNALTGWEPPSEKPKQIAFPGFEDERDAADKVKQEQPILVILGNPPYNAYAGISPDEENNLVEPYKVGLISEWGIKKFNLDDLYIRFFRLAEKRIAEYGGRGIVSFISNFSYLGDPSFVVARRRFLDEFDAIWLDCMNGDSRETGKLTPEGTPDPSVFSTEWNREGIRVGTAISLLVKRTREQTADAKVRFRHFWGTDKRNDLRASLGVEDFDSQYEIANPCKENRWSFRPSNVSTEYLTWPKLTELSEEPPYNGPVERRGNSLIVFPDKKDNLLLVKKYLDPSLSNDDIMKIAPLFMTSSGEFKAEKARNLLKGCAFDIDNIVDYPFKPFDIRLAYLSSDIAPLFSRPSPALLQQRFPGNKFFITRDTADKSPEGPPFFFSPLVCDYDCISGHARHFPLRLRRGDSPSSSSGAFLPGLSLEQDVVTANLSIAARAYLSSLGYGDPDADQVVSELIWHHALAIGYSPAYLEANADGVRQDWPRIPLPQAREQLEASAALGHQVAALLDSETSVPGVTTGNVSPELRSIAVFTRLDGKQANPAAGDLDLTAGWGYAGRGGITMPGKGKLRDNGDDTCDVFLNDVTCWRNVPNAVWNYYIGGYQVIKKWLSYRERPLLGRGLLPEEVRYVSDMARRLAALVALGEKLDTNYHQTSAKSYPWPKNEE
ncbi:MAG: N-6 DNA Methylase [Lentisphaerae bacterium ADurb.Bin082]|nr:MAG: N-6 DNA Methylase [Lentisphaerae bacterium ADurb.Bin082]